MEQPAVSYMDLFHILEKRLSELDDDAYEAWVIMQALAIIEMQIRTHKNDWFDFMELSEYLYDLVEHHIYVYEHQSYILHNTNNYSSIDKQDKWGPFENSFDALTAIAFWALYEDIGDALLKDSIHHYPTK